LIGWWLFRKEFFYYTICYKYGKIKCQESKDSYRIYIYAKLMYKEHAHGEL